MDNVLLIWILIWIAYVLFPIGLGIGYLIYKAYKEENSKEVYHDNN